MPTIDVFFRIQGKRLPADHGYLLYSAISRLIPTIHEDISLGLHPVSGAPCGNRQISLSANSSLGVRLDSDRISEIMPLAGKELCVGDERIFVGIPNSKALIPCSRLYSRLVVIKGYTDHDSFAVAAKKQLSESGINAELSLVEQASYACANEGKDTGSHSPYLRRTLRIRDKNVVGFAVRVEGLTAEESILLQEKGLGGRRRFGCGIFMPDRR